MCIIVMREYTRCDQQIAVGEILQTLLQKWPPPKPSKFFLPFIVTTTMDCPAMTLDDTRWQPHIVSGISKEKKKHMDKH